MVHDEEHIYTDANYDSVLQWEHEARDEGGQSWN